MRDPMRDPMRGPMRGPMGGFMRGPMRGPHQIDSPVGESNRTPNNNQRPPNKRKAGLTWGGGYY